jgi:NADH dehydrogenase
MIVIAGGSGQLGRLLVKDQLARGETVRVVVRDRVKAKEILGPDVEVMSADVLHADEVREAVQGASVVVSALHGFLGGRGAGPAEVDRLGNRHLTEAARAEGADVVMVSILGGAADSPVDLFREKFAAEQELQGNDVAWTIVRAGPFIETWLGVLAQTAGKSGRPVVFGRGEQPIPFVSVVDVASVVVEAISRPDLRGQVLEVAGPAKTMNEVALALQAHEERSGGIRHLPRPLLRAMSVLARPFSPSFARQNAAALAMDTVPLPGSIESVSPIGSARRSLSEVLVVTSHAESGRAPLT